MRRLKLLLLCTLCVAGPARAIGHSIDLEIVDTASGHTLPVYRHAGRCYVAGEPGHEYGIRLTSQEGTRLLAVTSVDGVNVVSGETAAPDQTGYVLGPYEGYDIPGWRKSLDRVASFYFARLPDSYAARTGRARDVGVIGVAVFREKTVPPVVSGMIEDLASSQPTLPSASGAAPPAAPAPKASRDSAPSQAKEESRLGTGHGRSLDSSVVNTGFERATITPTEVIALYYDSRSNLIRQGIIPATPPSRLPDPFPNGFVPDP